MTAGAAKKTGFSILRCSKPEFWHQFQLDKTLPHSYFYDPWLLKTSTFSHCLRITLFSQSCSMWGLFQVTLFDCRSPLLLFELGFLRILFVTSFSPCTLILSLLQREKYLGVRAEAMVEVAKRAFALQARNPRARNEGNL